MEKNTGKEYLFISGGVLVLVAWIFIFNFGLLLDSHYYRVAITYNFYDWHDWAWTIFSFTISNVIILAFLSGLLGGIASKVIITEGFKLNNIQLKEKNNNEALYENPFISGFRGVFVFLAILSFQYLSSFTDLSSLNVSKPALEVEEHKRDSKIYETILSSISDDSTRDVVNKIIRNEENKNNKKATNDSLIKLCVTLKNTIKNLKDEKEIMIKKQELNILRRDIQLPIETDIPGLTSASYFRFAVLVSFLSFIFGYDPSLFKTFLSKIPIANGNKNSSDNKK